MHANVSFWIAIALGIVPSILWLMFWLREDEGTSREPLGLIVFTFIAGMIAVVIVLPIQKLIAGAVPEGTTQIVLWAASEEILKLIAFSMIMKNSAYLDEPVEYPIYLMTVALGFAALENTLYLVHPLTVDTGTVSFLTGHLRFLGSTLLHSVTSGVIGISIGLAFFKDRGTRTSFTIIGVFAAVALHSTFNFFIIQDGGKNFLQIFGFLWVTTIIIMLLFEKLRRMGAYVERPEVQPV